MNKMPRSEFPRPDFERKAWQCLNGEWEFAFDADDRHEAEGDVDAIAFDKTILVPYCYQSRLSGIGEEKDCDHVWYRRNFNLTCANGGRLLLKFGAVDYTAKVWLNGSYLGSHDGGHTPFSFDITTMVKATGNALVVKATDYLNADKPRGKQTWTGERFGCWYTPTTGIWQSVWLESTGDIYLERIKVTPDTVQLTAACELFLSSHTDVWVSVRAWRETPGNGVEEFGTNRILCTHGFGKTVFSLRDYDLRRDQLYWSPEHPNLIRLDIQVESSSPDLVYSYFGMRSVSIDRGTVLLNDQPYFQRLILDQGYWPDTILTPPDDQAIIDDIALTKQMGFNGARKHQKPEDPRYYYWADVMGLLVWGEMPSAYAYNDNAITRTSRELEAFVHRDYNHPCIIAWVPINESWGVHQVYHARKQQDYCRMLLYLLKAIDPTRLVSANDGWEQISETDICAIHDYMLMPGNENKYCDMDRILSTSAEHRLLFAKEETFAGQPIMLTEFGGIAIADGESETWGYYGKVSDDTAFFERLTAIVDAVLTNKRFAGFCYTQLTDVMQETNGLLCADRSCKVSLDKLCKVFGKPRLNAE